MIYFYGDVNMLSRLTDNEGEFLVRLARRAVEDWVRKQFKVRPPKDTPHVLWEKAGVFVTITKILGKREELRGCIGYILPIKPLVEATIDVAIAAASEDPRFPPVSEEELDSILVEVTVLTPPEKIEVADRSRLPELINVGVDGLIVKYGPFSGTLLPQVPVEYGWDAQQFLENLCWKAGLPSDCWLNEKAEIYKYSGVIWKERSPNGPVKRIELQSINK